MESDEPGTVVDMGWELGPAHRQSLLSLARCALTDFLIDGFIQPIESQEPIFLQPRGVFVTLWRHDNGDLRGCRGEPRPQRPLIEAVVLMTIAAAIDDPRFLPVVAEELPLLKIEINILTQPQPILRQQIEIGRHGLLIEGPQDGGLLLPEVALRHHMNLDEFLTTLCAKAHLPEGAWRNPDCRLYAFETLVLLEDVQSMATD